MIWRLSLLKASVAVRRQVRTMVEKCGRFRQRIFPDSTSFSVNDRLHLRKIVLGSTPSFDVFFSNAWTWPIGEYSTVVSLFIIFPMMPLHHIDFFSRSVLHSRKTARLAHGNFALGRVARGEQFYVRFAQ